MPKIITSIALTIIVVFSALGQSQGNFNDNYWYFGPTNTAIVFDKTNVPGADANVVTHQATPFGRGGSTVITDEITGDLLFYSDGTRIYDASHRLVVGSDVLNGNNNLNNPAVSCPVPGQPGRYFIFTNPGAAAIRYSIVDKQLQGNADAPRQPPLGGLTGVVNQPTPLTNNAEAMMIVQGTADNYWLISQNTTTRQLRVLAIDGANPSTVQNFDIFSATVPSFEVVSMDFHQSSSLIALAPKDANRNIVILEIDRSTGALSFVTQVTNSGNNDAFGSAISDVAWSPQGNMLYFSRQGTSVGAAPTGMLYQVRFDSGIIVNSVLLNPVFRSYGIKRGPNGRIYHLYQPTASSPITVGSVNSPDSSLNLVTYQPLPLGNVSFNGIQFPEFSPVSPNPFQTVDFDIIQTSACANSQVYFVPNVVPTPHSIAWDFGDGNESNAYSPIHTYEEAYSGPVSMRVTINGVLRTVTKTINIQANELVPDMGNDTTICKGEIYRLEPFKNAQSQPPQGTLYFWSTGETTPTITANPDSTRTYWVYVQYPNGCTGFDEIEITVYRDESQVFNHWYFGQNAGINFTPVATALNDGAMVAPEGCSSVSDRLGKLLFYTNGKTVWNRHHQVMLNGLDIGGDSTATQSAMIVPVSGVTPAEEISPTVFYIFMPSKVWGDYSYQMRYAIVDIKLDSARGAVIAKNLPLFTNSTERLASTGFGGSTTLVVAHEFGNNSFRTFPVTGEGLGSPIISSEGSIHSFTDERNARGYMKISPNNQLLAVAVPGNQNLLEIFRYDSLGRARDGITINIGEPAPAGIYGVEFSTNSRRLFVTTNNAGSTLLQFSLDSIRSQNPRADIEASKVVVYRGSANLGAIQNGPDGQMYVAVQNTQALGIVNGANGQSPTFSINGFPLRANTASLLGLPNFVQVITTQSSTPGIAFDNACLGLPVAFSGSGTSDIDKFDWVFGDVPGRSLPGNPDTVDVQSPEKLYGEIGLYTVQLRVYNRCGFDSIFVQPIEIFELPQVPTTPNPQNICAEPFVELAAFEEDVPGYNYSWSTGETTRVIQVFEASTVTITVSNGGCAGEPRTIEVYEQRPQVSLGNDITVCQNTDLPPLNVNLAGVTFRWSIDDEPTGTNRTQSIRTEKSGIFNYKVAVFDPILRCEAKDSIFVTVQDAPQVTNIQSFGSACRDNNGKITFEIANTGSDFSYQLSGPVSYDPTLFGGINPVSLDNLNAGIYRLSVGNSVSGCSFDQNVTIEDLATYDLIASKRGTCGIELFVRGTVAEAVVVTIVDQNGQAITATNGTIYDGTLQQQSSLFTTNPLVVGLSQGGVFSVSMQETTDPGCIQTSEVTIAPLEVEIEAVPDCSTNGIIRLSALPTITSGVSYQWTDSNGTAIPNATAQSINVDRNGVFRVLVSDAERNCTATETYETIVVPILASEINLNAIEEICSQDPNEDINRIALEPGNFLTYTWTLRGNNTVLSTEPVFEVTAPGTYNVQLNNGSTCVNRRIIVRDNCEPFVFAPNIFTPNGDGLNDTFAVIPNAYVADFNIFIYNRWGELIYHSDNINFQWDGNYRGQPLQDGTYAYVMRYRSTFESGGKQAEQYGGIAILR